MTKNKITIIFFAVIGIATANCWSQVLGSKTVNPILKELQNTKGKGILFGHQDDLAYGMGWEYVDGESDVKRVAGDYPALFGWELGGIELGHRHNLDSVPFEKMKELAVEAHEMGAINTFSWHPYSVIDGVNSWTTTSEVVRHIIPGGSHHEAFKKHLNQVAEFLQSLRTKEEEQVPFIFRPWHEMDGTWFWWGSKQCTTEEFKSLFTFTIDYLRNTKGITEMLVAYSPDNNFRSLSEYYTWYPGDAYVDIMGMDNYGDLKIKNGEFAAIKKLHIVIEAAQEKNKFAALTETGLENVPDPQWYTKKLGVVLQDPLIRKSLSYVMLWRNDEKVHFFFTYKGHPAEEDARAFLNRPGILLLEDFNKFKN
jgi:mannan endo-1,4-beta-mannosidase